MTRPPFPTRHDHAGRMPAPVVWAVVAAVLILEVVIGLSFLVSWPPPTGDVRSLAAVAAAVIGLVVVFRAERGGNR